jgi:hypothetical protein
MYAEITPLNPYGEKPRRSIDPEIDRRRAKLRCDEAWLEKWKREQKRLKHRPKPRGTL